MALAFILGACALAGIGASTACLERTHEIPEGWVKLAQQPDGSQPLRMSFALRQPEIRTLAQTLYSGQRLSKEDVDAIRTADKDDVDHVIRWLSSNGIADAKSEKDWVHVRTTVDGAERLLQAKMNRYSFQGQPPVVRTEEYFVPDDLKERIAFVHPIANFMTPEHDVASSRPMPQQGLSRRQEAPPCNLVVTPECILRGYNIKYKTPDGKSPVRFAVTGFLDQNANHADTVDFLRLYSPTLDRAGYNFATELINGGQNLQERSKAGSEANLDIEYAMAVGYPTQITFWSTGGKGVKLNDSGLPIPPEMSDNEPYLEMVEHMLNLPDDVLPHVLTMSYADDELSVPRPYANRVCDLFGMLAARGMSVLVASGDGGARGGRNSTCRSNDGQNVEIAMATFPGTCPWVTAVGATTNSDHPPKGATFSTGGFSQWFDQPKWQAEAVNGYIGQLNGYMSGYYNPKKRAIPDIAAVGTQFLTIVNDKDMILDGTSASVPIMAAMIALINDARLRKGKPSLGWLNKRLYSPEVRKVLFDIVGGTSKPCQFSGGKRLGWPAAKGWDAITGLGTPGNFDELMRVLADGY
ncbi:hypothetical protein HIM_02054 [Hirsutella minnesotensis 3608]|nr:hypothetical protein HIM_02054 [Hirsutella minnesotensis 3608]